MRQVFKAFFYVLWRTWFYLLMFGVILLLFPFLLIATSSKQFYRFFFLLARLWGKAVLYGMGFYPVVMAEERIKKGKSYVFVANHASMMDIMLMLTVVKYPFVFIGKKELARFPVFGFFYKKTCILVDRSSAKSREAAFKAARERLQGGVSICIFPEGGIPEETIFLDAFKDGAFRLAIEHAIPILPLTFGDNKKRFPYRFFGGRPGKMRVKIHPAIETTSLALEDRQRLKLETRELIYHQLQKFAEEDG